MLALVPAAPPSPHDAVAVANVSIKPDLKLMSNSERGKYYRRKRKLFAADLETKVARLRHHVRTLEASRELQSELAVSHRRTPLGALAKLAREYYAQFEFGTPVALLPPPELGAPPVRVASASPTQLAFLRAAMEERVGFGDFAGISLLVDQWQRYSAFHSDLWFELKSLDVMVAEAKRPLALGDSDATAEDGDDDDDDDDAQPVIAVRANLHVRITRETIEQVFPHLLDEGNALVDELVGLEIAYPCVNHFYFTAGGAISRYDPYVDFVGALAAKIRSIAGVAYLLDRALIAKDHMIGALDDSGRRADRPLMSAAAACDDSDSDDSARASRSPDSIDTHALHHAPSSRKDRLALDFILS
ncbi:hypothetical protein PybrP1_000353 [[Pythium] brassicae (nom. inval.)]|nr:hypothetical protein PybrP1_000353 [[Pythium] brassicae (nom. inval.)]